MINVSQQNKIFGDIASKISKEIIVYAIGGTAMMFKGLKNETLDIDLVFTREEDRQEFKRAVKALGYEDFDPIRVYGRRENSPDMIKTPESRIDLFLNNVVNFSFTDSIKERARDIHQFDELIIKIADIHDIIIMKCATTRPKDELDIIAIIKREKIDWNLLAEEAKEQIGLGNELAVLSLGTLLEKLSSKYKMSVPSSVLDKLWDLLGKQVENKRKRK